MKKEAMIRARIEPGVKKEAEAVFKELGLNASEAIGLFYHQVKLRQGLPFEVNISGAGLKSATACYAQAALVKQAKNMSPPERMNAFLNHSYLMKEMESAVIKSKGNKKRVGKHAG